jgi:hypothetical protein
LVLNGTVNANGASTTVNFEYGTTSSYGSTVAASPSTVEGDSISSVSVAVGYYGSWPVFFRVKAKNFYGVVYGTGKTFEP